jgi:hypothetical protein
MRAQVEPEALLHAIERRLVEISERQHALAVERTHLLEQMTPLRLGVASPEIALTLLRSKGVTLRGLAAPPPAARRRRDVVLRAVPLPRARMASLPLPQSGTA